VGCKARRRTEKGTARKGDHEKGIDLFFYSKARRRVRVRVRKINLSLFF